jgi:phenol 2-monooxygenase (NADPH)
LPFPHPASGNGETEEEHEAAQRAHRSTITLDRILAKAAETFKPYKFRPKQGTEVEWWAGYQVGQRVASRFAVADSKQHPRIFLMGDACHTHSPSLGQGMNVSMMDAFDISWKMVHTLFGLTPDRTALLETYEVERREHALNLIDLDKRWYHTRYGKSQQGRGASVGEGQVGQEIMKFISGTAIEYQAGSMLVDDRVTPEDVESIERYSAGALREGRRLEDAVVTRLADGCLLHLHDEIRSDGRYSIVIWTGTDLLKKEGISQKILRRLCEGLLPSVARSTVKVFVLHSLEHLSFEWTDLPGCVRTTSETRLYKLDEPGYEKFGIDVQKGVMCVVRPDVYIGSIADLTEGAGGFQKVAAYLERCAVPTRRADCLPCLSSAFTMGTTASTIECRGLR